jgi:hypothetical protein
MSYTQTKSARFILLVTLVSVVAACGESDTGDPKSANWVYCDNIEAAALSCDLDGFAIGDDAELRTKLEGCTSGTCHGGGPAAATTWMLDLSGTVEDGLSALNRPADDGLFYLIDDVDPDCSQMLAEVSTRPVGAVRMPVTGGFWSPDQVDCFRSYLHDMTN